MDMNELAEKIEILGRDRPQSHLRDPLPEDIIDVVLSGQDPKRACVTCSFQAEDVLLLHYLRERIPDIPVLFLDTGYHFAETYTYRDAMVSALKLNIVNILPLQTVAQQESEFGSTYQSDPTRCCHMRKVEPLMRALDSYDIWFTGLRRDQSSTRQNLKTIEQYRCPNGKTLLKVSPLADWTWGRVWSVVREKNIPHLPQYDEGYLSIGCQPCTTLPVDPNNPRSGRWGGTKLECGIHTLSEKIE